MKEIFLIVVVLLFFIVLIISINKKEKNKAKKKAKYLITNDPLTDFGTSNKAFKKNNAPTNFVDNKSTSGGIIAGQMKKEKKVEESLKKPIGWVQAKSYDEDVRNTNVDRYVHTDEGSLKETIPSQENKSENKAKKSQITILVVDDSITILKFISNVLIKFNYELINKEDGQAAFEYLKMTPRFPDLIITDLEMPKMNGSELIKAIRNESKFNNIPILIVSSNPTPHIYLLEEGKVNGVISKPFGKEDFIQQVKYLLNNG